MNKVLELEGVDAYYDNKQILQNVNITVCKDDFIGIIGPNGGGKTTLLRVILGILPPHKGTVTHFKDGVITHYPLIGYLPQESRVDMNFPITVQEVVLSGLMEQNKTIRWNKENKTRVKECIELLNLKEFEKKPIGNLSGGQLQRTLLGRAIISKPELLILDEPNTYMDQEHEQELYDLLVKLNQRMSIIMVSHNLNSISNKIKSIAFINKTLKHQPRI